MYKYKINIIYNSKESINDIFIKVLLKELQMICKNKKTVLPSSTYLLLKDEEKIELFREYR